MPARGSLSLPLSRSRYRSISLSLSLYLSPSAVLSYFPCSMLLHPVASPTFVASNDHGPLVRDSTRSRELRRTKLVSCQHLEKQNKKGFGVPPSACPPHKRSSIDRSIPLFIIYCHIKFLHPCCVFHPHVNLVWTSEPVILGVDGGDLSAWSCLTVTSPSSTPPAPTRAALRSSGKRRRRSRGGSRRSSRLERTARVSPTCSE